MRRLLGSTSGVLLVLGALASPAAADDRELCFGGAGEAAIAACSRLIASDNLTRAERIKALVSRGTQYWAHADLDPTADRAMADFNEALRLDSQSISAMLGRCTVFMRKKDWDHAIIDCSEVVRADPRNIDGLNNRGAAYVERGDLDAGLSDLNQALRIKPNFVGAYHNRAIAYSRKKQYSLAIADASEIIRITPNDGIAFLRRGVFYDTRYELNRTQDDSDHAVSDYKEALRLDPGAAWAEEVAKRVRELARPDRLPQQAKPSFPSRPEPQQAQPASPRQSSPVDSSEACRRFPALC